MFALAVQPSFEPIAHAGADSWFDQLNPTETYKLTPWLMYRNCPARLKVLEDPFAGIDVAVMLLNSLVDLNKLNPRAKEAALNFLVAANEANCKLLQGWPIHATAKCEWVRQKKAENLAFDDAVQQLLSLKAISERDKNLIRLPITNLPVTLEQWHKEFKCR